jgi:pseudaminic acid synthase
MLIAEISGNHLGDLNKALALIAAAKMSGADAVKIQMFKPERMTMDSDLPQFMAGKPWNKKLYDVYKETAIPYEWIPRLQDEARQCDIELFTSIFDTESLKEAEQLGMPMYKVASFEINYTDLLEEIAKTGKPTMISTGIATQEDIRQAVAILGEPTILKCISKYPTDLEDLNLATIVDMKDRFGCKVGFSDHTSGIFAPAMAIASGADVIEKHICLKKEGPDASFSLTPHEFLAMSEAVRCAKMCMGKIHYKTPKKYGRSMVATEKIKKGQKLKGKIAALRTTTKGSLVVGATATRDYDKGDLINGRENDTDNGRNGKPGKRISKNAL